MLDAITDPKGSNSLVDLAARIKIEHTAVGDSLSARHGIVIRPELTSSDTATARGITVTTWTAVIGLCRALAAAGRDMATPRALLVR